MKTKIRFTITVTIAILFAVSCKKNYPEPPQAESISLVSGNGQKGEEQKKLPEPVITMVKDQYGNAFEGATLTVTIKQGEGIVSPSNPKTGKDGKAIIEWILGKNNNNSQELLISAQNEEGKPLSGSPLTVSATAPPKPPEASSIEVISGLGQTGVVNQLLPLAIEVLVKDQYGAAFAGAELSFSVSEGSVTPANVQSDANGKASVQWTTGASTYTQSLTVNAVQSDGVTPVYGTPFNIQATVHAPTYLEIKPVTAPAKNGTAVNTFYPSQILALVKDEGGNALKDAKVTFSVEEGAVYPVGSDVGAAFATISTDSHGEAKVRWKFGPGYGTQSIKASVTAVNGEPLIATLNAIGMLGDADGNLYQTIKIGDQLWMAENLKTTKYNDGTEIPYISDGYEWKNNTSNPAYCWYYNYENEYKEDYGALYNWQVVNTNKLCPAGWRIPTDAEWTALTNALGGEGLAGGKLKEAGTAHWKSPNTGATNETGFKALPGGHRDYNGEFFGIINTEGSYGYWWSSTNENAETAWARIMYYNNASVLRHSSNKRNGYSVRCVKD
ncbi:MAG: FISUMP domain-containing protein [Draconibacterium sp.]